MENTSTAVSDSKKTHGTQETTEATISRVNYQRTIIDYYSDVGIDYEPWSPNLNMHFGYFRWGLNPFNREVMLNEMNAQVCQRLQLNAHQRTNIIDLGCGVGATSRYCSSHYSHAHVLGITIVPWQIERAKEMTENSHSDRIRYAIADYCQTGLPSSYYDGAYAIESSCYAPGSDKLTFLEESYRLLKPGAKLVIADGFRKTDKANALFEYAYQKVCKGWSLEDFANIHHFTDAMKAVGFKNIHVEDLSWRIAPSILYVPWISIRYLFTDILFSKQTNKDVKALKKLHFIAPMMGLVIGLQRKHYAYYMVTAEK